MIVWQRFFERRFGLNKNDAMVSRVFRSVGADSLGQVLNMGIRLLLVPLFVSRWGVNTYGEWLTLTAVAGWFGLSDLGGQLYFVNRMTAAWATGRVDELQRLLSTGLLLFITSSTLLFFAVVITLKCTSFISWFGFHTLESNVAEFILILMAFRFFIALPLGLYLGIYRAIGAQATSVMCGNAILLIQFIFSSLALLAGCGPLILASLDVIPFLLMSIYIGLDLRKRLPNELRLFDLKKADWAILKESISPSFHFLGIQFALALMVQGSVIVVAKTLGSAEVAIFTSMRIVVNIVSRFLGILSHSAWPEMTRLAIVRDKQKLTRLFSSILNLSFLAGLIYLVFLRSFGEVLFGWWIEKKLHYDFWVMSILSFQVMVSVLWTFGGSLLMATNQHEEYALAQFPVNVFALLLCYFGAIKFGLVGAVTGLLLGQSPLMLIIVIHLLVKQGWKAIGNELLVMALICLILLPLTLNVWTGLVALLAFLMLALRKIKWGSLSVG